MLANSRREREPDKHERKGQGNRERLVNAQNSDLSGGFRPRRFLLSRRTPLPLCHEKLRGRSRLARSEAVESSLQSEGEAASELNLERDRKRRGGPDAAQVAVRLVNDHQKPQVHSCRRSRGHG